MRYTAELAERATAWLARDGQSTGPDGKRSAEGLLELATVWAAIQNVPLPACIRQCQYSERARDVAAYVREYYHYFSSAAMSDTQTTSKYQIAPAYAGQTFVHEDYGKAVTADNLTDEDAEFFIGKGRADAFVERNTSATASTEAAAEGSTTEVTPDSPLVPEADLAAEKDAHAATKQKAADALKAEKDAHKATKAELKESQKQVSDLQKQLEKLTKEVEKAAEGIAKATTPEVDAAE